MVVRCVVVMMSRAYFPLQIIPMTQTITCLQGYINIQCKSAMCGNTSLSQSTLICKAIIRFITAVEYVSINRLFAKLFYVGPLRAQLISNNVIVAKLSVSMFIFRTSALLYASL